MCESSAAIVAEAQLPSAPQGAPARLVLDLGDAHPTAAALARTLAAGVRRQIQTLLADPAADLPAQLRAAVAALADALVEQTTEPATERATVTILDTPLARAWRAHPAGRGAMSTPGTADADCDPDRTGDGGQRDGAPAEGTSGDRPHQLIGFCCPVCGFTRPAGDRRPVPPPLCAGAPARPGRTGGTSAEHGPTPMKSLFLH